MVNNNISYMNKRRLINELKESVKENPTLTPTAIPYRIIITVIIVILFLVGIIVMIYKYIMKGESIKFMNAPYYVLDSENSEIQCKSGCNEGKCEVGVGECKSDDECVLCADNKGGFYGNVPKNSETNIKIMEEESNKIKDLEDLIAKRNSEINRLNQYIEELKKKNNEVVYVKNSANCNITSEEYS